MTIHFICHHTNEKEANTILLFTAYFSVFLNSRKLKNETKHFYNTNNFTLTFQIKIT
jgi:hypothetical protein